MGGNNAEINSNYCLSTQYVTIGTRAMSTNTKSDTDYIVVFVFGCIMSVRINPKPKASALPLVSHKGLLKAFVKRQFSLAQTLAKQCQTSRKHPMNYKN